MQVDELLDTLALHGNGARVAERHQVQAVGWLTEHGLPIPYVRPEWAIQVELAELVEGFGDGRDLQGFLDEYHTTKERGLPWPPKAS